jgi:general secretion pathway protein C
MSSINVAARFTQLQSQSRSQWLGAANRIGPPLLCAVLIVTIAYKLAQITWALMPGEAYDAPAPEVAASTAPGALATRTNFTALRESHLFDVAPAATEIVAPPPTEVVDAPNTTLNLRLSGVVVREINTDSEAMIATGNQPDELYRIGDTVEGGNGATLHRVYADRVILNHNGRLETLRRPDEAAATPGARRSPLARAPSPVLSPSENPTPLRQVISNNASKLTNIMRFAPHVEGGQVIGFRVTPGQDADAFAGLGLEPGDVVTDINGLALDDPSRGLQAFEALGEATMANVTIMRNGTPQVIVIDTSQLDALSEDRQ